MIDIQLNTLPGLESLPDEITFPGNEKPCQDTPPRFDGFVFRVDVVRPILGWLSASSSDGLLIFGDRGCGKSSTLRQLHAYLNRPLFSASGHSQQEFDDLLGTKEIVAGDTIAYAGPLLLAANKGATFLWEEIDRAPETASVGLNSVLDGYPIPTLDGGVFVSPKPNFRVAATANTSGSGDMRGDYNTANVMDSSLTDRFWVFECFYPTEDEELSILQKAFGDQFGEQDLRTSIRLANDVRYLYSGEKGKATGNASNIDEASIDTTFSTRSLVRMWEVLEAFGSVDKPLEFALGIALTNKIGKTSREAILQLATAHFGEFGQPGV